MHNEHKTIWKSHDILNYFFIFKIKLPINNKSNPKAVHVKKNVVKSQRCNEIQTRFFFDPRVNLVQPDRTLTSWPYCSCKKTFLTKHGGCRCSWLPSPRRLFTNFYKPKPNHNANEIAIKMRNFFNMNFGVAINPNPGKLSGQKTLPNYIFLIPIFFFSKRGFFRKFS